MFESVRVGSDEFGSGFGSCCERSIDNMFLEVFGVGVEAMCEMIFIRQIETKGSNREYVCRTSRNERSKYRKCMAQN